MEWLSAEPPHQLTRNEGCAISTNSLFTQSQEQTSPHQAPQFNGVVSYIDEGGGGAKCLLKWGIFQWARSLCRKRNVLVYNLRSASHSSHRTESESGYCETLTSGIRYPKYTPLCDMGEQETSAILLPVSNGGSICNRCTECKLDRDLCKGFTHQFCFTWLWRKYLGSLAHWYR